MRQEVISEQLRIQRLAREQARLTAAPGGSGTSQQAIGAAHSAAPSSSNNEISPEFLLALPEGKTMLKWIVLFSLFTSVAFFYISIYRHTSGSACTTTS